VIREFGRCWVSRCAVSTSNRPTNGDSQSRTSGWSGEERASEVETYSGWICSLPGPLEYVSGLSEPKAWNWPKIVFCFGK
jgi:hypothetical protein